MYGWPHSGVRRVPPNILPDVNRSLRTFAQQVPTSIPSFAEMRVPSASGHHGCGVSAIQKAFTMSAQPVSSANPPAGLWQSVARLKFFPTVLPVIMAFFVPLQPMAAADEPLRQLINRELALPAGLQIPPASDAEFLRRAALDLTGMPPSAADARAFLADQSPDKREKLIDRLLQSPLHHRHLAATLDVMLMERRGNAHVSQDDWMNWLMSSIRTNKPWNVLVREMLMADGEPGPNRPSARFLLDRAAEPHIVARDIGRLFFGRDMQCAQCHDSPLVADFLQQDYQGLLAVSSATYTVVKKIEGKDVTVLGERAGGDLTFESVFIKGTSHRTGPRLPGMTARVEPFFLPGSEYEVAPADGIRGVPKVSRRTWLATVSTDGTNTSFNENAANRLWFVMFGRGLVQPLDMLHSDNPAVSPQLLQQLGRRFADSGFDIRNLLREIVLSEPWQRPFDLPSEVRQQLAAAEADSEKLAAGKILLDAAAKEAAVKREAADQAYAAAEAALIPVAAERDKLRGQATEALKKRDEAKAAAAAASAALAARANPAAALEAAAASASRAAAALPDDTALATLAQTLAAKAQANLAELPPLRKAAEEKAAAIAAPEEAFTKAIAALQAAQELVQAPLDAVAAAEVHAVAARQAQHTAQLLAVSQDARLRDLQKLVEFNRSLRTLASATQLVASSQAELTSAKQQLSEQQPLTEAAAKRRLLSEQQLQASQQTMTAATAQQDRSTRSATALAEAVLAADRAAALLQSPPALAESTAVLKTKSNAANAQQQSAVKASEAAAVALQAATIAMQNASKDADAATSELERRRAAATAAETAFTNAQSEFQATETRHRELGDSIPSDFAARFALTNLKPLTPEQLCWTVFKVSSVYDRYREAEIAELDKSAPLTDEQKQNPAVLAEREQQIEQRTYDKLKGNIGAYAALYGGAPGQPQFDFYASADQALFTANGGSINSWIAPGGGNTTERVALAADSRLAAEELYLGMLTRMPTPEEAQDVAAFLAARPDRRQAALELVWALLSSAEFRFNH